MRTNREYICFGIVILSLMVVPGCWWDSGSSPGQLFVPDSGNSRVLVYGFPLTNGQAAVSVLGQSGFNGGDANFDAHGPGTATPDSMAFPTAVAIDGAGNLYVADMFNCRVLQFSPPFTMGKAANFAIGQADLYTVNCLPSPIAIMFDKNGNLWLANKQLKMFPANHLAAGATATVTIGTYNCPDTPPATAAGLCYPTGVAFDSSGNLWLSDTSNSRVLMFPSGNLVTGASATFVLGQPAITGIGAQYCNQDVNQYNNGATAATAKTLCFPTGLTFDSSGNLWVADTGNSRVLMYAQADLTAAISAQTNDVAATFELGQPAGATAFTSPAPNNDPTLGPGNISASTLAAPLSVSFDSSGRLIVGDMGNNRILFFAPPFNSNNNGKEATLELGQPAFATGDANYPATPGPPPTPGTPSAANLFLGLPI